jgi:hypothetical protein
MTKKEIKNKIIPIRITPSKLAYIDEQAKKLNLNRSTWIEDRCFSQENPQILELKPDTQYYEVLKQLNYQLAMIGNNINQISRHINTIVASGGEVPQYIDSPESLTELSKKISQLKSSVAGIIKENKPPKLRKRHKR